MKRYNNDETKTDEVIVKTKKTASPAKFKLKEGFKPITVNARTEYSIVSIWCSNQMRLLPKQKGLARMLIVICSNKLFLIVSMVQETF